VAVDDQIAGGRVEDGGGEWAGGHIGIEDDEGEARGLKEDDHHEGERDEGALAFEEKGAEGPDEEGDGGDEEREAEVGEGCWSEVEHVSHGEGVGGGVRAEGLGDVTGGGNFADVDEDGESGDSGKRSDEGDGEGAAVNPEANLRICGGHGGAEEESEGGVAGHGVVLLRGGEGEESENEGGPGKGEEAGASGAVGLVGVFVCGSVTRRDSGVRERRFERKFGDGGEVEAPGEKPDEMEKPEKRARDGVVVARVAKIEKAEELFVDEVEPEEAVILAGAAVEGEGEVGRIAESGKDVPGRGDEYDDEGSGEEVEALPDFAGKKLAGEGEIDDGGAHREDDGDEAFEEKSDADGRSGDDGPGARMSFVGIEDAEEGPEGEGHGKGEDDVGNEDASEEEETDAGADAESGVKAGAFAEGPDAEGGSEKGEADGGENDGEADDDVRDVKHFVEAGDEPVEQGSFFEIGDAVEAHGDEVMGGEHGASHLSVDGVDVVHEGRRGDHAAEVDGSGEEEDEEIDEVAFAEG